MKNFSPSSPPNHALAIALWFATLITGTILLSAFLALTEPSQTANTSGLTLIFSIFAIIFSLPVLLVLPICLRWVFTAATTEYRWLRLLLSIIGLFASTTFVARWVLEDSNMKKGVIEELALPYLVAAILSALCLYYRWLFYSPPIQSEQ